MSFTKSAVLPVTPDEAFALLTEPERLRRWQTITAFVDLRAGGAYRWNVTPGHVAGGTYREVEPGKRIVFGWGWDGNPDLPPDASTVTVTFEPVAEGTLVTLVHEGLTAEQAALHAEGWNHYFERLEKLATTGDAGADEWVYAPANLTPTTAADATLAALQPVLRNFTQSDRALPTPCDDFTVHDLAEHLMVSLTRLGAMAGANIIRPEVGSLEAKVSILAAQATDAWREVDLDGTLPGPNGTESPADLIAGLLPVELLVHGWDLAVGTGQELHVSDELVTYVHAVAVRLFESGRGRGKFGPEVTAAADASPLQRLVALTGRDPQFG